MSSFRKRSGETQANQLTSAVAALRAGLAGTTARALSLSSLSSPSLSLAPPPALCRAAPPHCPAPFPSPRVGGAPLHEGNSPSLRSAPSKTSLPSRPALRFKIVNINNVTGCFLFLKELSGTGKTV